MNKFRKIWLGVLLGLAIVVVGMHFLRPDLPQVRNTVAAAMEAKPLSWFAKEKSLTEFASDLHANKVVDIGIGIEYAFVTLDKAEHYYFKIDSQRPLFIELLKEKHVGTAPNIVSIGDISLPRSTVERAWAYVTPFTILPLLLLLGFGIGIVKMGALDQSKKLFKAIDRPKSRFSDVIGSEEAKAAVSDIVAYLKNPKKFTALGGKAPRGLILEGPPGTGKTLLARALAGEVGGTFIAISGADFSDKFLGAGIARVKKLFAMAGEKSPSIIFIDEIDSLGARGMATDVAGTENNRIINALLVELDGFRENNGVIVIGATNHLSILDPAMTRPGRFDRIVRLTLPRLAERQALFELYAKPLTKGEGIDYVQLARLSAGLSPASIAGAVNTAALLSGAEDQPTVTHEYLMRALEQQQMGAPTASGKSALTPEERRRITVHEAGHALVTHELSRGVVEKVSILPRGEAGGVTWVTEATDVALYTEEQLCHRMSILLAGRGAEQLVLGNTSTGASNDLEHVTRMAHQMATCFGFSKTLGAINYDGLPLEAKRSSSTSPEVMAEVRSFIAQAEAETALILISKRSALDAIIVELAEKETLTGDELSAIIVKHQYTA